MKKKPDRIDRREREWGFPRRPTDRELKIASKARHDRNELDGVATSPRAGLFGED